MFLSGIPKPGLEMDEHSGGHHIFVFIETQQERSKKQVIPSSRLRALSKTCTLHIVIPHTKFIYSSTNRHTKQKKIRVPRQRSPDGRHHQKRQRDGHAHERQAYPQEEVRHAKENRLGRPWRQGDERVHPRGAVGPLAIFLRRHAIGCGARTGDAFFGNGREGRGLYSREHMS